MATWKRLTDAEGHQLDINLDNIAYIRRGPGPIDHAIPCEHDRRN